MARPTRDAREQREANGLLTVWLPALLLLAVACAYLYCPATTASNLSTVPDSVEYATAARRLATLGRYDIEMNHVAYPPRYPPGFPVLLLAPLYRLAPGDLGTGVYAVLVCGLVYVLAAYAAGRRLGGSWGGVLAGLAALSLPGLRQHGREIMSDVPTLALELVSLVVFLRLCERPRLGGYALAGVLVGIAYSMREVGAALWLPFAALAVRNPEDRWRRLAALTVPVLLAGAAIGWYNLRTFGDWMRTGYQYWCAVPYDYPGLTFSPRYVGANLRSLVSARVGLLIVGGTIGAWLLARSDRVGLKRLGMFLLLGAGPIELVHLLYFASDVRFHFLALAVLAVVAGAGIGRSIPRRFDRLAWLPAALALPLAARIAVLPDPPSFRRVVARAIADNTPANAVIVTAIDAVFLDPDVVQGSDRLIVPADRHVEYASKLIVKRRVARLVPPPRSPVDHRALALLRAGAIDPFPYTAADAPDRIAAFIRAGRPVYVDHSYTGRTGVWTCANPAFTEEPVEGIPWLRRLRLAGP